jgi:hypothetical protein
MTQFHEGQEVEVLDTEPPGKWHADWRKAKIVDAHPPYIVEFTDGTRAGFDAEHIMPARELCIDCGKELADFPSKLCPGCEAYRERYI